MRIFLDRGRDSDSIRRFMHLLDDLGGNGEADCAPPLDVVEYDDRIEITVDIPGVPASGLQVVFSKGTLVIAGRKLPRVCQDSVAFHLAERGFGRFVRAIGVSGAFDASRARASLTDGELRISMPRIEERRDRDIHIEVTGG
jgi:HSP20 family protein